MTCCAGLGVDSEGGENVLFLLCTALNIYFSTFLHRGRIACKMQIAVLAAASPSVCLSVSPSVTRWYCTQTNKDTHTHTFIKITHQTCMNENITDETMK